jgi:3-hydroxyacyl-CoA dehydrogenase/enoyl-CoA hydratase/3-hydroxybutyryl-CoA epimerase
MSDDEITDRIQRAMVNEAARCLDEKVVSSAGNLDMAVIMGIGYPPFRGGILRYADDLGIDRVVARLKEFETKYGKRFAPAPILLKMNQDATKFYSPQPHSNLPAKQPFRALTTIASK